MIKQVSLLLACTSLIFLGAGCDNQPLEETGSVNKAKETGLVQEGNITQQNPEATHETIEQEKYTTYSGAYFDIDYPTDFSIDERVLDESMTNKYAEVAFISPNKNVEFHVYSPLWGGVAQYETVLDTEEVVAEQQNSTNDGFTITTTKWITIEAKDGSYARSMRIITTNNETVRYLFGITYSSQEELDLVREEHNHFTTSLVQFADA